MEFTATEISVITGLVMILGAGARGIWVWGWHLDEVKRDRDEWKHIALSGTLLAERSVEIIDESAKH